MNIHDKYGRYFSIEINRTPNWYVLELRDNTELLERTFHDTIFDARQRMITYIYNIENNSIYRFVGIFINETI